MLWIGSRIEEQENVSHEGEKGVIIDEDEEVKTNSGHKSPTGIRKHGCRGREEETQDGSLTRKRQRRARRGIASVGRRTHGSCNDSAERQRGQQS